MNNHIAYNISAFTENSAGGNAAGVLLDAESLGQQQRQNIARKLGFSETAFVSTSDSGELRIDFFTPNKQIDICGHATVGTFSVLRELDRIKPGQFVFNSAIGQHRVQVEVDTVGLLQQQISSEIVDDQKWRGPMTQALNIRTSDIVGPLVRASNGSPFVLIELSDSKQLAKIDPDQKQLLQISEALDLVGFYLFVRRDAEHIEARMFAPRYGIGEESATGMAAGALALMLYQKPEGPKRLTIRQGHLMAKPSPALLRTEVRADNLVLVSGEAVMREKREITSLL